MKLINLAPPKNWEELVEKKDTIPLITPQSARMPEDLEFYRLYRQFVPQEIRHQILFTQIGKGRLKIIKNTFPYRLLLKNIPEAVHYCMWCLESRPSAEEIENEIKKTFGNKKYFWFENIDEVKSIPEIWHCHIFVKEN
jgi:hypothetical protein